MKLHHRLLLPALLVICLTPARVLLGQPRTIPLSTLSNGFSAAGPSGGTLMSSVGPGPAAAAAGSLHRIQSGFLAVSQALSGTFSTANLAVQNGWNLVSVPLTVTDYAKETLFPTATSSAFAYQGGYFTQPVLSNGAGYWLKFASNQNIPITGFSRTIDSIAVQTGWNLIGSISSAVPVGSIGSVPGGIVTSQFFGYNAGSYGVASSIAPGRGYWVKVSQDGRLILASSSPPEARIRIVPTPELPPSLR